MGTSTRSRTARGSQRRGKKIVGITKKQKRRRTFIEMMMTMVKMRRYRAVLGRSCPLTRCRRWTR
jgi:hypothetical protein